MSVKFLSAPTRKAGKAAFAPGKTESGVAFLRGFVGTAFRADAATPLVVVLHGTGYNAGVWLPTLDELHDLCVDRGVGYDVVVAEWTGHGASRKCPGTGVDDARYDLSTMARDDVFAVGRSPARPRALRRARARRARCVVVLGDGGQGGAAASGDDAPPAARADADILECAAALETALAGRAGSGSAGNGSAFLSRSLDFFLPM